MVLALCTGALAAMIGCQKVTPKTTNCDTKISVSTLFDGVAAQQGVKHSRAIVSNATWKNGNTFSMWVVPYIDATANKPGTLRPQDNYIDNVVYTYASAPPAAFTTTDPIYYPTNESKVDLYAISPSISGNLSSTTAYPFEIKADQTTSLGIDVVASDIMTGLGAGGAATDDGKVTVLFTHRMSKAVVKLTLPTQYKEKNITSITKVEVCEVPLKSTLDITDAAKAPVIVTTTNPKTNILAYQAEIPTGGTPGDMAGEYLYEAIVTPGTAIAAGSSIVRVTLAVDGISDPVVFDCTVSSLFTFEAKSETIVNISIEDQTAIVLDASKVTIAQWGTTTDVKGSPIKLSRMIFDIENTDQCTNAALATKATLKIEGDTFQAKVTYNSAAGNAGQYILEFDQKSNFGGNLEEVTLKTATDVVVGQAHTGLSGYQIKGDPTLSTYNTVIAKISFTGQTSANITKK